MDELIAYPFYLSQSRLFDGHKVRADFYDEKKFEAQIFDPPPSESTKSLGGPPAVTPTDDPITNGNTAGKWVVMNDNPCEPFP